MRNTISEPTNQTKVSLASSGRITLDPHQRENGGVQKVDQTVSVFLNNLNVYSHNFTVGETFCFEFVEVK